MNKKELSEFLGRDRKSVVRTLATLRAAGLPIPPVGESISEELAAEIKMRLNRDKNMMCRNWLAEIDAAKRNTHFDLDNATVDFDPGTGVLTIAPKGMTATEQAMFTAAMADIMRIEHGVEIKVKIIEEE